MAEKRMFTQKIIDSDAFLDMPLSTQALYFHLNMRADDDGFVNNPKRIQRTIGASEDDLKLLIAKRFVIGFDSGVLVIKHWRMHNTLRKDRYNPTQYQEELALLEIKDNNAYTERLCELPYAAPEAIPESVATTWQPDGNHPATQYSIGKYSIDKRSIEEKGAPSGGEGSEGEKKGEKKKETTRSIFERLLPDYSLSSLVVEKMSDWITYKTERKEPYKEQGMKALLSRIKATCQTYGEQPLCDLIDESMANNWAGICFDKLKQRKAGRGETNEGSTSNHVPNTKKIGNYV